MVLKRANEGADDPRKARVVSPFRLVSYDPGGSTGVATSVFLGNTDLPETLEDLNIMSNQFEDKDHHTKLWNGLKSTVDPSISPTLTPIPLEVVCESFEFRQHMSPTHSKTKVELISKEYIGIIKLFCQMYSIPLTFNTASAAKTFVTDDKIKQLGLWKPGNPHANDAIRHLLRYLVVNKKIREPITNIWLKN